MRSDFVKDHLGPALQQNGLSTKIWILDHNYNFWGRAICELDDQDLRKYCNAVAFHGYVGTPDMMDKVHDAHPDAQLYWTEGGPDYTAPDYATDWTQWGHTFTQAIRALVSIVVRMESGARRKGKAEHRAVSVRRAGHHPFPDERDHAQRTVLGVCTFFEASAAWGKEI